MRQVETLIIGGGLAGLSAASALRSAGREVLLVEARSRLGGRVFSERHGAAGFDLGPAWFWPGQPRMARMLADLGLERFDQYAQGALLFEASGGQVQRGKGFSSMEGSWRVEGGMGRLIEGLAARLPAEAIELSTPVVGLEHTDAGIIATTEQGDLIRAGHVILAMPPRVMARLALTPEPGWFSQLSSVPTWMAGQAKAVAVYDTPFWRDQGLSGDAMSQQGPLVEIHDASPARAGPSALFGFIGVPAEARRDQEALKGQVTAQLTRLFGPQAATPLEVFLTDWAQDPFTATDADSRPLRSHPAYGFPPLLERVWEGRLVFAGSELAEEFGGYLEGALASAERAVAQILTTQREVCHGT